MGQGVAYSSGTGMLQWDSDILVGLGHHSGTGNGIPWWDWDTAGIGTLLGLGHCWDWDTGTRTFQQYWDILVAQGYPKGTEIQPGETETLQGHLVWDWDIVTGITWWDWNTLQRDTQMVLGHPSGTGTPQWDWDTMV